jgi:hypothetical protein
MSYQAQAQNNKGFKGAPTANKKPAAGTGTKPTHALKVKDGDKFIKLCNVFTNTSEKTGDVYLKGKDSQSGVTYFIMPIKEFDKKEGSND